MRRKIRLWMVGVVIGIVFLVIGFQKEQFSALHQKAIMICLECIGIG